MNPFSGLSDAVVGRVTFPLVNYLYNRRGILGSYRTLMKSQLYPAEALRELQLRRVRRLLGYANQWVPFYTERFAAIGLTPEDVRTLDDLEQIPPLSRQEVIDRLPDMVDLRQKEAFEEAVKTHRRGQPIFMARFRRRRLVRDCTTGSSGTPTVTFEDGTKTALNWAHEFRLRRWYGVRPGAREARFARLSTEQLPSDRSASLRKYLWHQLTLGSVNLKDDDHEANLRKLREFRPKVLFGTTFALTGLADYIRRSGNDLGFRPATVITWAEPQLAHEKRLLEEVFECPVANLYGSREVGHIASSCPEGSLHVNQENYYVESLRGRVANGPDDVPGELLVTPLLGGPMPFIRYRIGDLGDLADETCGCGRSLQVMKSLAGRTGDVYRGSDGRTISFSFWTSIFGREPIASAIKRFQVVYGSDGGIRVRIVRRPEYSDEVEAELRRYITENFPPDTPFEFDYPAAIGHQPTGKYQLVIHEPIPAERIGLQMDEDRRGLRSGGRE